MSSSYPPQTLSPENSKPKPHLSALFLDGSHQPPPKTITRDNVQTPNLAYNTWIRQDRLLFGALIGTLEPTIVPLVCLTTTSKELWDTLMATFASSSRGHINQLKARLKTITKGPQTVTEFMFIWPGFVRLGIFSANRIALSLKPKQPTYGATDLQCRLRPPYQPLVKIPSTGPLANISPSHCTRDQPHHPNARVLSQQRPSERHPGPNATYFIHVDISMKGLRRQLPVEIGTETEDGKVRKRFRRDVVVPGVVHDTTSAGHVALTGQQENAFSCGGMSNRDGRGDEQISLVEKAVAIDLIEGCLARCQVHMSRFLSDPDRIGFDPQTTDGPSAAHRRIRPPYHLVVENAAASPLADISPSDCARNQPHDPNARVLSQQRIRERHPRTDAAHLCDVDVTVERLSGAFPGEVGTQAEDGGVGGGFRRDVAIPSEVDDPTSAGHVALAGQKKNALAGQSGCQVGDRGDHQKDGGEK
ncbi:hypothetical protein OSB04_005152 [Centaurea solstitialis]|uniref:Uncharacterized protein n=1 Tax=Centaurea solstitialis TaxID=347529 RepID=A0AA38TYI2_9ASTR|nr:hypothetical protein OSB04_005152 [Centaurea solstitialis]